MENGFGGGLCPICVRVALELAREGLIASLSEVREYVHAEATECANIAAFFAPEGAPNTAAYFWSQAEHFGIVIQ